MLEMLAFDLGASSGRTVLGSFDGNKISVEETHRFPNQPVFVTGIFYWDALRLLLEIKTGLSKCVLSGKQVASMAVDAWAADFGLLDADGNLISNPYHYRNLFPMGMTQEVTQSIPYWELYERTGAQIPDQSTMMVLYAMQKRNYPQLKYAKTLLMIPDLYNYFLSGEKTTEYTVATTSRLLDSKTKDWTYDLMERLNIPKEIFTPVVQPGTVIGSASAEVQMETGCGPIKVIATASHDTAAAVAALPDFGTETVFISSGSWSVLGVETDEAIISPKGMQLGFINEGSACGKIRFLKNIVGHYFIECCRAYWEMHGEGLSYADMDAMAEKAPLFRSFIDPTNYSFLFPGDMPQKIQEYCRSTGQAIPQDKGEMICAINQSLAFEYRRTIEQIEELTGKKISHICMVGGGVKNKAHCQYAANATGKVVTVGYSETVCVGNLLTQALALGEIQGLSEIRQVARNSFELGHYEPQNVSLWDAAYEAYLKSTNH
jgi:sugar (pentulose or hexulose) kinase